MGLSLLDLDVNLTWSFSRDNGVFRATKQGKDSRSWSLDGLDLTTYDQAIVETVTLGGTDVELEIDLTSEVNLVNEAFALTVVQTILILAAPNDPDLENCGVRFGPGSLTPFRWTFGSDTDSVTIDANGVYLQSDGVGSSGTNIRGRAVTASTKRLRLTHTGQDDVDVFFFVGGSTL